MISKQEQLALRMRYNPDGSSLRKAQLRMVDMLDFLDKVCRENNLTYWLDSGTLLGAERHGGFIPWDDYTDVAMPYNDMLKLKDILDRHPGNEFVIQCHATDANYFGNWMVLRDLKSEYVQDSYLHNIRKYRGLQVDIFPMESNPGLFRYLSYILCSGLITAPLTKGSLFIRGGLSKLELCAVKIFHFTITKLLFKAFRTFKGDKRKCNYGLGIDYGKYYNTKDIYPIKRIMFEGHSYNAPNNVAGYLESEYGNWQDIPDEKNIITHNVKVIFK